MTVRNFIDADGLDDDRLGAPAQIKYSPRSKSRCNKKHADDYSLTRCVMP
jgi:hypothetical protein